MEKKMSQFRDPKTSKIYSSWKELQDARLADELSSQGKEINNSKDLTSPTNTPRRFKLHIFKQGDLADEGVEIKNQMDSTTKKIIPPKSKLKRLMAHDPSDNNEEKKKEKESKPPEYIPKLKRSINDKSILNESSTQSEEKENQIESKTGKITNLKSFKKAESKMNESSYDDYEPKIMNGNELLEYEEDSSNWIIDQFLPIGLTILGADPKTGKSRLARSIAMDIIFGNPFFNSYKTEKGGVLYLSYEEGPRTVKDQIDRLLANREIERMIGQKELINFHFVHKINCLEIGLNLEDYIEEQYRKHSNIKLIIIDPYGASMSSDNLNTYSFGKDYKGLAGLQHIAVELQIAIMVIAHTRKSKSGDNPFNSISGTLGVTAPPDCLWVLIKSGNSGNATLHVRGREREDGAYSLNFNNQLMEWEYVGEKIFPETTPEREEIINLFIPDPNAELKVVSIYQKLGKKQNNISSLIGKLVYEGILENGSIFGYYRLTRSEEHTSE